MRLILPFLLPLSLSACAEPLRGGQKQPAEERTHLDASDTPAVGDAGGADDSPTMSVDASSSTAMTTDTADTSTNGLPDMDSGETIDAAFDGSTIDRTPDAQSPVSSDTPTTVLEPDAAPPAVDAANACAIPDNGECAPLEQCGCGAGQSCIYTAGKETVFVCAIPGTTTAFNRCHNDNDCVSGLVCHQNLCTSTCRIDDDCGNEQDSCVGLREKAVDGAIPGIRICERRCESRIDAESCGLGARCSRVEDAGAYCRAHESALIGTRVTEEGFTENVYAEVHAGVGEACQEDSGCALPYVCNRGQCQPLCERDSGVCN